MHIKMLEKYKIWQSCHDFKNYSQTLLNITTEYIVALVHLAIFIQYLF